MVVVIVDHNPTKEKPRNSLELTSRNDSKDTILLEEKVHHKVTLERCPLWIQK